MAGEGEAAFITERSAEDVTVVVVSEVLFVRSGSGVEADTEAPFTRVPDAKGLSVPVITNSADSDGSRDARK